MEAASHNALAVETAPEPEIEEGEIFSETHSPPGASIAKYLAKTESDQDEQEVAEKEESFDEGKS